MIKKLKEATITELQIWMLSAAIFGVGLGAFFSDSLNRYSIWLIFTGIFVHLIIMYRIYMKR